jgi:hypothetical protein
VAGGTEGEISLMAGGTEARQQGTGQLTKLGPLAFQAIPIFAICSDPRCGSSVPPAPIEAPFLALTPDAEPPFLQPLN